MAGRKSESARAAERTSKPVRSRFAEDLDRHYPEVAELLRQAGQAVKRASVPFKCKKCGASQMQYAEVQDGAMAIKVAEFLANQGLGRPGEDVSRVESSFVVNRHVVPPLEVELEDED